jgi:hypothetical protein
MKSFYKNVDYIFDRSLYLNILQRRSKISIKYLSSIWSNGPCLSFFRWVINSVTASLVTLNWKSKDAVTVKKIEVSNCYGEFSTTKGRIVLQHRYQSVHSYKAGIILLIRRICGKQANSCVQVPKTFAYPPM